MAFREFPDDVIEELLARLASGESLSAICKDKRMPSRQTIHAWSNADDGFAQRVQEAREVGYHDLAERALRDVEKCKDPIKARLVFDARRWYLGKLSNAFRDRPVAIGTFVGVGGDDAFAAVAGALDRAAAGIASSGHSTRAVAIAGEAGSGDAAGRLADLAGAGGERLGQDQDGR